VYQEGTVRTCSTVSTGSTLSMHGWLIHRSSQKSLGSAPNLDEKAMRLLAVDLEENAPTLPSEGAATT
jgi:hypothetical protein